MKSPEKQKRLSRWSRTTGNGGFEMVYFCLQTKEKVKIETYTFDKDAKSCQHLKRRMGCRESEKWKFSILKETNISLPQLR